MCACKWRPAILCREDLSYANHFANCWGLFIRLYCLCSVWDVVVHAAVVCSRCFTHWQSVNHRKYPTAKETPCALFVYHEALTLKPCRGRLGRKIFSPIQKAVHCLRSVCEPIFLFLLLRVDSWTGAILKVRDVLFKTCSGGTGTFLADVYLFHTNPFQYIISNVLWLMFLC